MLIGSAGWFRLLLPVLAPIKLLYCEVKFITQLHSLGTGSAGGRMGTVEGEGKVSLDMLVELQMV